MSTPLEEQCCKCGNLIPSMFNDYSMPINALYLNLSGGYGQFFDTFEEPRETTEIILCHKCGHDFMTGFMGVPAAEYSWWHPKTQDEYCEGWTLPETKTSKKKSKGKHRK